MWKFLCEKKIFYMQKPKSAQQMAVSKKWVSFAGWGPSDKRCSRASNSLFKCGSNSLFIAHTFVSNSQIISLQWSQICGRTFTAWIFHFFKIKPILFTIKWLQLAGNHGYPRIDENPFVTPYTHTKMRSVVNFLDCLKHYFSLLDL